ncbi:MAG TPA: hypothetical protein VNS32_05835 [Flavisolibacter sp.]|nr:hypothetical protein [Flavisolibacter sp.]
MKPLIISVKYLHHFAFESAAQYDALVAAWYYKKLYRRPAPYKTDLSIQVFITKTDLPSYPSAHDIDTNLLFSPYASQIVELK